MNFKAGDGSCTAAPCTYTWSDDGPDGPDGTHWPLGSGSELRFTFSDVGRKYVRMTVTDSAGKTISVRRTIGVGMRRSRGLSDGSTTSTIPGSSTSTSLPNTTRGNTTTTTAKPATTTTVNTPSTPSTGGFPDATNTGVAGCPTLTPKSGDMNISQDGTVVENISLNGAIAVHAKNVSIRCVKIKSNAFWPILIDGGGGGIVDSVEIDCGSVEATDTALGGDHYVANKLNIHDCKDAVHMGSETTLKDSYIHDLAGPPQLSTDSHPDGIMIIGPSVNVKVLHNTIFPRTHDATSAIIIKTDLGPISNVLVDGNRMNYGAVTINIDTANYGAPTNLTFTNNRFGRGFQYGLTQIRTSGTIVWTGNVWDDTGAVANR